MQQPWICLTILIFAAQLASCGATRPKAKGPNPCKLGEQHLRQSIGPEFGRVEARAMTGAKKQLHHGCALVYTRLAEELPEEVSNDDSVLSLTDHRLALMLLTEKGNPRFLKVARGRNAPGPVSIKLYARDMNGDQIPDFVVQERARLPGDNLDYQNLRIIDGSGTSGRILFDRALRMRTKEGLELIPRWSLAKKGTERYLLLQGGGRTVSFVYDKRARAFRQSVEKKSMTKTKGKPAPLLPEANIKKSTNKPVKSLPIKSKAKKATPKMETFLIDD